MELPVDILKHRVVPFMRPLDIYNLSVSCRGLSCVRMKSLYGPKSVFANHLWSSKICSFCKESYSGKNSIYNLLCHCSCASDYTMCCSMVYNPDTGEVMPHSLYTRECHSITIKRVKHENAFLVAHPGNRVYRWDRKSYIDECFNIFYRKLMKYEKRESSIERVCGKIGRYCKFGGSRRSTRKVICSISNKYKDRLDEAQSVNERDQILYGTFKKCQQFYTMACMYCKAYFTKLHDLTGKHWTLRQFMRHISNIFTFENNMIETWCHNFETFVKYFKDTIQPRMLCEVSFKICDILGKRMGAAEHSTFYHRLLSRDRGCDILKFKNRSDMNWDTYPLTNIYCNDVWRNRDNILRHLRISLTGDINPKDDTL